MKRSMLETMNRLEIDKNIRPLIRQLWKRCYRTTLSCEGKTKENINEPKHHSNGPYVVFETGTGDGWFAYNSKLYGLKMFPFQSEDHQDIHYEGKNLISNPFEITLNTLVDNFYIALEEDDEIKMENAYKKVYDIANRLKDRPPKIPLPLIELKKDYKIWKKLNYGLISILM